MKKRRLGQSSLEFLPLAFGGNVFGWTIDQAKSFAVLDRFVDDGFQLIDTADVYSAWVPGNHGGESETIIGQWLKKSGKRSQVLIATKCGMDLGEGRKGLSKAYIKKAVEASLTRLGTDYIDLYQAHRDDPETPLEETVEAFADLVKAGKVRTLGASNYTAERLTAALKIAEAAKLPRFESLQPPYNLFERDTFEDKLAGVCQEHRIGVITYFSLASGFLSGKYRSQADFKKSARGAGMEKYLTPRGLRILDGLDAVAAQTKSTPTRVALAWLIAKPAVTAPIASATSLEQFTDLAEGAKLQLTAAMVQQLDDASRP